MTSDQIKLKEEELKEKIAKSKKVETMIDEAKSNLLYLDPDEIEVCQKMIKETVPLRLV